MWCCSIKILQCANGNERTDIHFGVMLACIEAKRMLLKCAMRYLEHSAAHDHPPFVGFALGVPYGRRMMGLGPALDQIRSPRLLGCDRLEIERGGDHKQHAVGEELLQLGVIDTSEFADVGIHLAKPLVR
jgi:hypothetical protein